MWGVWIWMNLKIEWYGIRRAIALDQNSQQCAVKNVGELFFIKLMTQITTNYSISQ